MQIRFTFAKRKIQAYHSIPGQGFTCGPRSEICFQGKKIRFIGVNSLSMCFLLELDIYSASSHFLQPSSITQSSLLCYHLCNPCHFATTMPPMLLRNSIFTATPSNLPLLPLPHTPFLPLSQPPDPLVILNTTSTNYPLDHLDYDPPPAPPAILTTASITS